MGYLGTGLLQGFAQGQQIADERNTRKTQLDLAKKRFDLEEKEQTFKMEQMKKQLQALSGLNMFGGGQPQGQEQPPQATQGKPAATPQVNLPQGAQPTQQPDLRSMLTSQGPSGQPPQENLKDSLLNTLGGLEMTGFNTSGVQGVLERQGRIPVKPSAKLSPEEQFLEEFKGKNPQASIADALKAYKQLDVENKVVPDKAPLPTTDKGYTIQFDPKMGVNVAAKIGPDGKATKEQYDPSKHGMAVATSETPLQRELEKGILRDV